MNTKLFRQCGILSLGLGALMLAACASQPSTSEEKAAEQVSIAPAKVAPLQVSKPAEPKAPQSTEAGSFASLVDKLEHNRRALYWKERNAYGFYIGDDAAVYTPGKGLTVTGSGEVECRFSDSGKFEGTAEAKKACQDIMYSLDLELGD